MKKKTTRKEDEKRELIEKIASKSKLTMKDVLEFGRKVNEGIARRHKLID